MLNAFGVDCKSRVWMPLSMQEVFWKVKEQVIRCSRVSGLCLRLSHAAGLYGVRGLGPNR